MGVVVMIMDGSEEDLSEDRRRRSVVMAVAHGGVKDEDLAVFAGSYREWASAEWCDMVILVNHPLSSTAQEIFRKYNVRKRNPSIHNDRARYLIGRCLSVCQVVGVPYDTSRLLPERLRSFHPSTFR